MGDIAVSKLGKTLDSGRNKGNPYDYLCAINIKWGSFDLTTLKQILLEDEEKERYLVRKGDLLICEGGDVGRSAIWESNKEMYYQNAIHRVRFYGEISQYYFLHLLEHYKNVGIIDDVSKGVTIKHFTQNAMQKILFPIPPLAEQRRIVAEVEKWFALIDDLETNKQDLQSAVKQVRAKVLDLAIHGKLVPQDPNDEPAIALLRRINPHFTPSDTSHYQNLPRGWKILKVGDVAEYINGRAFKPEEWEPQGLPIIRIQNLNDEDAAYNYSTAKFEDKYLVHEGDLLFAWAASLGTYIWNNGDAWLNQHIFKVVPKPFILKEFLYYSFIVMIGDFYAESHGSGMVHITKGRFEDRPILIPPITEQKKIVSKIEEILSVIDTISAKL